MVVGSVNHLSSKRPRIRALISYAGLAILLALPSGGLTWFDGLPWANGPELIALAILLPLLILVGRSFPGRPWVWLAVLLLLALKAWLFAAAPTQGWGLRIYDGTPSLQRDAWEPSFETLWQRNYSTICRSPWTNRNQFPIGWINRVNDFHQLKSPDRPRFLFRPWLRFSGYAALPPDAGLALVVRGNVAQEVLARSADGRVQPVPLVREAAAAAALPAASLPRGDLQVRGLLRFGSINGPQWSFIPVVVFRNGVVRDAFAEQALWLDAGQGLASRAARRFYGLLGQVVSLGIALLLLAWAGFALLESRLRGLLDWRLALVSLLALAAPWGLRHCFGPSLISLAQGLALASVLLVVLSFAGNRDSGPWGERVGAVLILALGPALLLDFALKWWAEVHEVTLLAPGHDYLTYQRLARQIVLEGDWLNTRIKVLTYQPLYRYVTSLLHVFFGPSMFTTRLFDVWMVLGGSALVGMTARRMGCGLPLALAAGAMLACHYTGDRFLFRIGEGLQEYSAMFFMMLAAWLVVRNSGPQGGRRMLAVGLVAAAAQLLRMDHLPVIMALGLLQYSFPPLALLPAWKQAVTRVISNWKGLAAYLIPVVGVVILLPLRNYWYGGLFTLNNPDNITFLSLETMGQRVESVLRVLMIGDFSSSSSPVIWAGMLAALGAALWRPGFLRRYPLALSLALIGLPLPYFFLRSNFYFPRWSIHLLPLAVLSLTLCLHGLRNWAPLQSLCNVQRSRPDAGYRRAWWLPRCLLALVLGLHLKLLLFYGQDWWVTLILAPIMLGAVQLTAALSRWASRSSGSNRAPVNGIQ